jgi:hypothetical protein
MIQYSNNVEDIIVNMCTSYGGRMVLVFSLFVYCTSSTIFIINIYNANQRLMNPMLAQLLLTRSIHMRHRRLVLFFRYLVT